MLIPSAVTVTPLVISGWLRLLNSIPAANSSPSASSSEATADAALPETFIPTRVNKAVSAAMNSTAISRYSSRLAAPVFQNPRKGTPISAASIHTPAIKSIAEPLTSRLERYTAARECPITNLLRMVPSLYSVPINRLVNIAPNRPTETAK